MAEHQVDTFAKFGLKFDLYLPVIVTSSIEGLDSIVRCLELGANDYILKTVKKALLTARVSSGLEKERLNDQQKRLLSRFASMEVAQDLQASGFSIGGVHQCYRY